MPIDEVVVHVQCPNLVGHLGTQGVRSKEGCVGHKVFSERNVIDRFDAGARRLTRRVGRGTEKEQPIGCGRTGQRKLHLEMLTMRMQIKMAIVVGGAAAPIVRFQPSQIMELFDVSLAAESAEKWTCLFSVGFRCGKRKVECTAEDYWLPLQLFWEDSNILILFRGRSPIKTFQQKENHSSTEITLALLYIFDGQ